MSESWQAAAGVMLGDLVWRDGAGTERQLLAAQSYAAGTEADCSLASAGLCFTFTARDVSVPVGAGYALLRLWVCGDIVQANLDPDASGWGAGSTALVR